MKKSINAFAPALFYAVLPVSLILLRIFGYKVVFDEYCLLFLLAMYVIISVAFAVMACRKRMKMKVELKPLESILSVLFLTASWFVFLFKENGTVSGCMVITAAMFICFVCEIITITVSVKYKAAVSIFLCLMCVVLVMSSIFFALFGTLGETKTVEIAGSPKGIYRAEVVCIDQGALGGNTVVDVYDCRKELDLHFVRIFKKPERVYIGEWYEYEDMMLAWSGDKILVINDRQYQLNSTCADN